MNMFASTPTLHSLHSPIMDTWNPALSSLVDYNGSGVSWASPGINPATSASHSPFRQSVPPNVTVSSANNDFAKAPPPVAPTQPSNTLPNLQLHLYINWNSDLRITLTTSLLINYPSPMFMSLPIKLSITGLVFTGEVAVAYEGERATPRVHICILDDLDPYGPKTHPKREPHPDTTPPLADEAESMLPPRPSPGSGKPQIPIGHRLLPSIFIESEIGQAESQSAGQNPVHGPGHGHVLKNVNRVERFIQDVIRKAVEEELVFPNFHTLVLGERNALVEVRSRCYIQY